MLSNIKFISTASNQNLTEDEKNNAKNNIGVPTQLSDLSDGDNVAHISDIPTSLSELSDDSNHRTVTDAQISQISTNKDNIDTLKGEGDGSILSMIDSRINTWASQLTEDGVVNTYAEAISWIATHASDYTNLLGEVSNKVDKISGKGLSTNDLTSALKSNYDTAYNHSQSPHARTDATKVETSSINGNIKINDVESKVYEHPGSGTNPHGTTKVDVGLSNVGNFKAVSTVASQGLTDTEKSNARANIGAGTGNGTYSKPSGGIPATDLASSVQTSLDKADTALQSHQSLTDYVKTTDSRLTDARASNDVQAYAKTGSGITVGVSVPSNAKFTDTTYSTATTSTNGLMSSSDKTKLNGIATGATAVSESTVSEWGFTKNTGDYSKPSTGIPKSDLSSDIQSSLDKADSALQQHQSLSDYAKKTDIPTIPTNVSAFTNDMGYLIEEQYKGTYNKPSGGIPKSDLASDVQASLGKADTALQSYTEKYTGTVTQIKVGSTSYNPSSGVVNIPAYPTTLPASDVYSWAKASTKPTYTASEVGAASTAVATTSSNGLMSASDKTKLNNIDRGNRWTTGVYITGTSTTPTVFSNTGITDAIVGDMYLNSSTYNLYQCTTAGNASTARWKYICNIKGATGSTGISSGSWQIVLA